VRLDARDSLIVLAVLILAATTTSGAPLGQETLPSFMVGRFVDDYGIEYRIGQLHWHQLPDNRFDVGPIINVAERYLVARQPDDVADDDSPGPWVRIDWVELEEGGEYPWAFCYAAYEQPSMEAALAVRASDRATPRTGCNGFPFSRMRPIDENRATPRVRSR